MDLATVFGFLFGVCVVAAAIGAGGDFGLFVNVPGMLIVIGGTFASTMIKFPVSALFVSMPIGLKLALTNTNYNIISLQNFIENYKFTKITKRYSLYSHI